MFVINFGEKTSKEIIKNNFEKEQKAQLKVLELNKEMYRDMITKTKKIIGILNRNNMDAEEYKENVKQFKRQKKQMDKFKKEVKEIMKND